MGKPMPVRFAKYTGQESDEEKLRLRQNPPHILLTNYVMLELMPVSYTHLRAHETVLDLVCRLLLEKKQKQRRQTLRSLENTVETPIHNHAYRPETRRA